VSDGEPVNLLPRKNCVMGRPYGLTAYGQLITQKNECDEWTVLNFCHCEELTELCLPISRGKISCRLPSVVPRVIVSGYVSE